MTWNRRFRLREGLLERLWPIPLAAAVLGAILGTVVSVVDEEVGAPGLWQYSPSRRSSVEEACSPVIDVLSHRFRPVGLVRPACPRGNRPSQVQMCTYQRVGLAALLVKEPT
jgi:hypothetical protein